MTPAWASISWDEAALNHALAALASTCGLCPRAGILASVSAEARASA
jgi:hypothetical protein